MSFSPFLLLKLRLLFTNFMAERLTSGTIGEKLNLICIFPDFAAMPLMDSNLNQAIKREVVMFKIRVKMVLT